ncbi:NmrA-like family protein [Cordyceps javanica]|uniref:NmrA-like family protein n=1 Tax=Cordyceps javanica TaxID=43265 RepID=A0A545UUY8_9HYPO|nr:NmrA-like family protein [Cordyceps javanica]TQW05363.1 NmrA-like family protein [Cordyceps javanica]
MSKTIVVLGATGNQGGSVASTFLRNPEWRVRAVTRDAASAKAASLRSRGAEVVEADLDDPASLRAAFAGAHAVYAVTDPLAILTAGPEKSSVAKPLPLSGQEKDDDDDLMAWAGAIELQQLRNVADAAAAVALPTTLERLVLSVLQDTRALSGGKYARVHHFEAKARAEAYVRETHPDLWSRTSSYVPGWFLSNILPGGMGQPQKSDDGTLLFAPGIKPTTRVPVFAAEEDSGPIVESLVREPTAGKKVVGERASMTFAEFLDLFARTTGRRAAYAAWPTDPAELPFPPFLREPLLEMTRFWDEFGYLGGDASVISPKDLTYPPVLETVEQYLEKKNWE